MRRLLWLHNPNRRKKQTISSGWDRESILASMCMHSNSTVKMKLFSRNTKLESSVLRSSFNIHQPDRSDQIIRSLKPILVFLQLLGLEIGGKKQKDKCQCITLIGMFICNIVFLNHVATFIMIDVGHEGIGQKIQFTRKFSEFNSIILWYFLLAKRHELFDLLVVFGEVAQELRVRPPKWLVRTCLAWLFTVLVIGSASFVEFTPKDTYGLYLSYYTFQLVDRQFNSYPLLYVVIAVYYFTVYVFHASVSAIYVCLCCYAYGMLQKHLGILKNAENQRGIIATKGRDLAEQYERISKLLQVLENSMSFVAFNVQLQNFCGIFNLLVHLGATAEITKETQLARTKMIFVGLYAAVSFLALSIFALRVNEMDKSVKTYRAYIAKSERLKDPIIGIYPTPACCAERAFVLSGWGFFDFNKKFLVSSTGSLLTYTLLIIQIKSSG